MPLYDLMLLLDPGAPSDRQESILKDVQGLIESGGKLVGTYDWGTRRMTFEIDHRPDAAYHLMQFETEGGPVPLEQVDHSLKIMDGVLRHRIIRLKDGAPPPPMPSPDRRGGYGDYEAEGAPTTDAAAARDTSAGEAPAAPASAAPVADAPTTDAPTSAADAAAADASTANAPAPDAAVPDAPTPDAPAADAPAPDAAVPDAPAADAPTPDAPAPAADAPTPDAPAADAPATDAPEPAGDDDAPSGPAAA